ncbi:MAG: protein translocase subunit SecD [Firmicutes bacterium]|nr:protein translocase subunit SecD [Bacillota bacterium]
MRQGTGWRIGFILIITLIAGFILLRTPINLGLDLQGGVHVVLEAQDVNGEFDRESIRRAQAVIERRINALGVSEPIVQPEGNRRIIVELPGIHDQEQAIETIGKTALLEFKDPNGNTVLTGALLQSATIGQDQFGRPAVNLEFNQEGAELFAFLTARYVGQVVTITLDNEVIQRVTVREPIPGGKAQITGLATYDEAREITVLLQSGSLPVPLEIIEIRNIGPSLGQDSISRSIKAGIFGIIFVVLYMMFYYKLPGFVADISLGIYVILTLAIFNLINATLTLPGIAGLILSVGMAVDANVLIFEQIKEELNRGKRLRPAIEAGFNRAFVTILDSNITTLISAGVLFYFGSSIVRGFAVTLSIGILVSMFTAIVVTRSILNAIVDRNPDQMIKYFNIRGVSR